MKKLMIILLAILTIGIANAQEDTLNLQDLRTEILTMKSKMNEAGLELKNYNVQYNTGLRTSIGGIIMGGVGTFLYYRGIVNNSEYSKQFGGTLMVMGSIITINGCGIMIYSRRHIKFAGNSLTYTF